MFMKRSEIMAKTLELEDVYEKYKNLYTVIDEGVRIGLIDVEGAMYQALLQLHERLFDAANLEWLSWYIFDNDHGKAEETIEVNGKAVTVKSLRDLAELMLLFDEV